MAAKIKICGITNIADGRLGLGLGADLLGYNFYQPSPRYVTPDLAGQIVQELGNKVSSVGVFVNAGLDDIRQVLAKCPLDMIQLHGDESNDQCKAVKALGVEVIKAIRIRKKEDITQVAKYDVETVLLDAFNEKLYGGTGERFDWGWIKQTGKQKVFLAGGITPDNIIDALEVGTYAVDLCSGVEKTPGIKDANKMRVLFSKIAKYNASCE